MYALKASQSTYTREYVMDGELLFVSIMGVSGSRHGQMKILRQIAQMTIKRVCTRKKIILDLDVKRPGESGCINRSRFQGLAVSTLQY